ncbi:MAG TPA: RagB/SusD family nutrient uptake outer membrane protein, partial [Rikenellaceae bacterium]|nr:RagB/SusD family nutrient uptake outer membrane protein [Rikenellaceae bacterium]
MNKLYTVILLAAMALPSCDSFLTQENPNSIESEFYFTDESSLEIYTNGLIRSFATNIKSFIDGDKNADTHSWDGQAAYFMDNYSAEDATNWSTGNWAQLRSINYYLDNMRNASASEEIMNHYEGVGRFFRALFYFDKVKTFG